jgi:DNA-3-methyladenine glycosylase
MQPQEEPPVLTADRLPSIFKPLRREDLPAETVALARFLVGKLGIRELPGGVAAGRIVETEAYITGDQAAHTFRGMTLRNSVMFGPRGHAYVYLAYGVSYMLNVSSAPEGIGEGVLIRAAEPILGVALMLGNRGAVPVRDLMRGPGRLAKALAITRALNGLDLCREGPLWLASDAEEPPPLGVSVRIGINRAAHLPLRFFARGSPFVSGPASLNRGG